MPPRTFSSMGLMGKMDGNVLGGLTLGVGMALSGTCPGTMYAQIGAGFRSSLAALAGALGGGVAFTRFIRPWKMRCQQQTLSSLSSSSSSSSKSKTTENATHNEQLYVHKQVGLSETSTILALETVFVAIILAAVYLTPAISHGFVHPVLGGLLIAAAQLLSALTRKRLLGTSTSLEEAGDTFWWMLGMGTKPPPYRNLLFASGAVLGALIVSRSIPAATRVGSALPADLAMNPWRVALGGCLLAVGSLTAGGCPSGHGISGISLLGVSSFVTVASMFAGGITAALVLRSMER
jgi:uncharacterized membrane protein YedE/YeeE